MTKLPYLLTVLRTLKVVTVVPDRPPCTHCEVHLSRGVLPDNLRRGPYAVVDERCEDTTLNLV